MVSEPSCVFSYPLQESLTVEWESLGQVGAMADESDAKLDLVAVLSCEGLRIVIRL